MPSGVFDVDHNRLTGKIPQKLPARLGAFYVGGYTNRLAGPLPACPFSRAVSRGFLLLGPLLACFASRPAFSFSASRFSCFSRPLRSSDTRCSFTC